MDMAKAQSVYIRQSNLQKGKWRKNNKENENMR